MSVRAWRGRRWPLAELWLWGPAAVLIAIGVLSVYAATRNGLLSAGRPGTDYLKRDLLNALVAAAVAVPLSRQDYRQLRALSPLVYGGLTVLLLAVLSPLGSTINGAHAWFSLGPAQFEPSEFMKLGLLLLLAALLSERRDREDSPGRAQVLWGLGVAGLPTLLVLAEPALGIAIVLVVITLSLLAISGVPARVVSGLIAGVVVGGALAFGLHLLKPYQEQRFTAFTDAAAASHTTAGYQMKQSLIAIGSGGLTGQGFLAGSQTDGGFVPEEQTDFVFTVSAEEGGLVTGSVLLIALGVLLLHGLRVAQYAPDLFGRLLAGGVVMWLAFQSFVNIGMTLGITPVTGLPLPFVSYGGSSVLADLLAVAVLVSIKRSSAP